MSKWEARDDAHLFQMLVGDFYGARPEKNVDVIRAAKKDRAANLCKRIGCDKASVVLEIGSGVGFTSKHVAGEVKRLYCCDISDSFLNSARKECAGIENIEFVKLNAEQPGTLPFEGDFFDAIFADAVFIHLNLYDIFWYFSEFQRVAKRRASVYINVMNASHIDLGQFSRMAGFYRKNRASLDRLLCWSSIDAVVTIAEHFGFVLKARGGRWGLRLRRVKTPTLLFEKR